MGALGFGVVTGLSFLIGPCHGCDRLAELFAVVRTGVAGGISGAVVSASYDRMRWAGAVGEYALGAAATWLSPIEPTV